MQCVEKGLLELDAPIGKVLPQWSKPEILTGFGSDGKPTLKPAGKAITLRMLLSHSSGMSYAFMDPEVAKWVVSQGRDPGSLRAGVEIDYTYPLVFEPTEGWTYSCGIDWAGKMVEQVNDGMKLGDFMKKNIFDVLGMTSTTFHPHGDDKLMQRMCQRPMRGADGFIGNVPAPEMIGEVEDDYGGGGMYSCASDYIKVLSSLLVDDGKLLKPETAKELFKPALVDDKYINEVLAGPFRSGLAPGWTMDGVKFSYSVGGCLVLNKVDGVTDGGLLYWSGLPNSQWVSS